MCGLNISRDESLGFVHVLFAAEDEERTRGEVSRSLAGVCRPSWHGARRPGGRNERGDGTKRDRAGESQAEDR